MGFRTTQKQDRSAGWVTLLAVFLAALLVATARLEGAIPLPRPLMPAPSRPERPEAGPHRLKRAKAAEGPVSVPAAIRAQIPAGESSGDGFGAPGIAPGHVAPEFHARIPETSAWDQAPRPACLRVGTAHGTRPRPPPQGG